jgi:RNA polymerase sigma-70 factor (ECF subfamily)
MSNIDFKKDILPFQDKMYRYALSIVFDAELAKDIVQEVLLKLWDKRADLEEVRNKEAWCIRLTRNKAYDKLKLAHRKNVDLEQATQKYSLAPTPDDFVEDSDLIQAIYNIMKDLSEKQREIFRLRDLLGYSNKEIKEIMGLNDSQVKVNLFRARQTIKLKLGKLINYGL